MAGEVAQAFAAINAGVQRVDELVLEIASASGEQTLGIRQVNNATAQMDKVTQQNAANAEESASAAEELNAQAQELQKLVQQFHLGDSQD